MFDKKTVAYFLTVIVSAGSYAIWNLSEQRKLSKRIKRNEEFLVASEALRMKYAHRPDFGGMKMQAELIDLMKKYEL